MKDGEPIANDSIEAFWLGVWSRKTHKPEFILGVFSRVPGSGRQEEKM
jgi:hypothetical protein